MRNAWRVLVFDVAAPLATIAAVLLIGVFLGWPVWWVAVAAMLCLLIVEAMVLNYVLLRRDRVTAGTDDDGPVLRLGIVALTATALIAATAVGYTQWTVADAGLTDDSGEVVRLATAVSEATATFSPQDPTSSIDRAAALMAPEAAEAFKANFGKATEDLARRNISAQARTISAGVEAIGPDVASVVVVMRGTQNVPGQQQSRAVLALRVAFTKVDDRWLVVDVAPVGA